MIFQFKQIIRLLWARVESLLPGFSAIQQIINRELGVFVANEVCFYALLL